MAWQRIKTTLERWSSYAHAPNSQVFADPCCHCCSPLRGPNNNVQGQMARQCRPALLLLFQTLLYLWAAPCSVKSSSIWFQTLCCSHPTFWLPSSLPSLSPPKVGQRWHVAHLLQLTNEGSRMERGRVFISKSHRLFREVLQASVEIGSIFRHRFSFQAKRVPVIVRVLFPASLGTQSSMEVSVASPSSFVRCRGRC